MYYTSPPIIIIRVCCLCLFKRVSVISDMSDLVDLGLLDCGMVVVIVVGIQTIMMMILVILKYFAAISAK